MDRTLPTGYVRAIMGQPITVTENPTRRPGLIRFVLNRTLTGMGHEHYDSAEDAVGDRPPDVVARRAFQHGAVKSVHVYSNEVTIELLPWKTADGIKEAIEGLYIHYLPGVVPSLP
jgi:hypothetical protein